MVATPNCKVCGGLTNAVWNFADARRYENCERCGYMQVRIIFPVGDEEEEPNEFRMELLLFLETKEEMIRLRQHLTKEEE